MIIDHGHVVLAGDRDDLRAAVPERFVDIRYLGVAPNWTDLSMASVVDSGEGYARLRVNSDLELDSVVRVAQRYSQVVSFSFQPPTLSELFREAVAA